MKKSHSIETAPIKIGLAFSLVSILLYAYGPFDFPEKNRLIMYVFLSVTFLAMYMGFKSGAKENQSFSARGKTKIISIDTIINILFWSAFISAFPKFIIGTNFEALNGTAVIQKAQLFFSSAQDLYAEKLEMTQVQGIWRIINWIVVLLGPLHWAFTPVAVVFWKRLSDFKKIGAFIIWLFYLLTYLMTGTNVGIFNFFLTVGVAYAVRNYVYQQNNMSHKNSRHRYKSILAIVISVVIVLVIFNISMGSRIGYNYDIVSYQAGSIIYKYNPDSPIFKITPSAIHPLIVYLTKYISQSYIGLCYSFDLPFQSTFGLGHSWFLLNNAGPLSEFLWDRTYPMQIEQMYQYSHTIYWHTAYTWFANDISFFGVPILFYFLFRYFGKAWKRLLSTGNIVSFLIFLLFVKMMFYLSANNQVFQASDTMMAFWILLYLNRKAMNYKWSLNA